MNTTTQEVTLEKPAPAKDAPKRAGAPDRTPRVDVTETPDAYVLTADVPGVSMDAIEVTVEDDRLELSATRDPSAPEGHRPTIRQFSEGGYRRAFKIPEAIDRSAVQADLRDGVLRITLPKAAPVRPQKVQVRAG